MADNRSRGDTMDEANMRERDGRADFDFHIGRWDVHHQLLRDRLKGSTSWEEFAGTSMDR